MSINELVEAIQLDPMSNEFKAVIRHVVRLSVSFLTSIGAVVVGLFVYFFSPMEKAGVIVASLFVWPLFLMQAIFFGFSNHVPNFDPVVFGKYGWIVMWFYYYLLSFAFTHFWKRKLSS